MGSPLRSLVRWGRVIRHLGAILFAAARATPRLGSGELAGRLIAYGVASLPIVGIASVCVGMVMGLHTVLEFGRFGVQGLTARVVAVSVLRELGPIFTYAMIALACGYILYHTSNVLHHYRIGQHVAAALALFASVALLFWYILQLFMSRR